MRYVLTAGIIGMGLFMTAPASAQGIYIGPGGVGVDTGIHRHRDKYYRDRDRDRDYGRDRDTYEGRSVYHDRYDRNRD